MVSPFPTPHTKPEGIHALARKILPEISRNGNPFCADTTITHLLAEIDQRPDGRRIIQRLFKAIDATCGLDVVTAANLKEVFQAWLRSR